MLGQRERVFSQQSLILCSVRCCARSVLGSIGVVSMSCKVNFDVVSDSMCLLNI